MAEIHGLRSALPERARIQHTAADAAALVQVQRQCVIAHHVHLLIDEALIGDMVQACLKFQHVAAQSSRERQRVVRALRVCGGNSATAAVGVVLRPRPVAGVTYTRPASADPGIHGAACILPIAPVKAGDAAVLMDGIARAREDRRRSIDRNRPSEAIASRAHRRNAPHHCNAGGGRRRNIAQRRIHVVGARGRHGHPIDRNARSLVAEAVQLRNRRQISVLPEGDARNIRQQLRGIASRIAVHRVHQLPLCILISWS